MRHLFVGIVEASQERAPQQLTGGSDEKYLGDLGEILMNDETSWQKNHVIDWAYRATRCCEISPKCSGHKTTCQT